MLEENVASGSVLVQRGELFRDLGDAARGPPHAGADKVFEGD